MKTNTKKNEENRLFKYGKICRAKVINLTENHAVNVTISQDVHQLCHGQGPIQQLMSSCMNVVFMWVFMCVTQWKAIEISLIM